MKKILVAVDFSEMAKEAVGQAAVIAKHAQGELLLLYVAPPNPDYIGMKSFNHDEREELADVLHQEHSQLQDMAHRLTAQGIQTKALLVQGDVIDTILDEARKKNADMIAMGSHGYSGISHALLGSISEGVLRKSKLPVLIVPFRE